MRCVIVDYGLGNLRSIQHKLQRNGVESEIAGTASAIAAADLLIFPGVGHFAMGMKNLKASGLIPVLNEKVLERKTPIMGICLGMQLFTRHSEEGDVEGLGWLNAETKRFKFSEPHPPRIPHIGWNTVRWRESSPLAEGVLPDQQFYFVHSYHVSCSDNADVLTTTEYGREFVSAVHRDNIFGTQFHPEKSHREGMRILLNFISFAGSATT